MVLSFQLVIGLEFLCPWEQEARRMVVILSVHMKEALTFILKWNVRKGWPMLRIL